MAYVDAGRSDRRMVALGAVAAVHLVMGYAIVTGLAVQFLPPQIRPPVTATNIPVENTPVPVPPPSDRPSAAPDQSRVTVVESPPVAPSAAPTFTLDAGPSGAATGTGIGDAVFPTPTATVTPPPTALPSFRPVAARPRGNPGTWVTPNDYPSSDLRLEHQGITGFKVAVGSDGKVTDCMVTSSSGWPTLDAAACARIKSRARFDPARDETGATVPGSYANTVKWEIPAE